MHQGLIYYLLRVGQYMMWTWLGTQYLVHTKKKQGS